MVYNVNRLDELMQFHQSNHLYVEEDVFKYQKGGYRPVHLGDTLQNDRYRIEHKLGFGRFSTVWLAEDIKYL